MELHYQDAMSRPFEYELHPALQEVIDAYEARRPPGDSLRALKVAIDDLCMEYAGRLDATVFKALDRSQEENERQRAIYGVMLRQLRGLQDLAAGKREVLSATRG